VEAKNSLENYAYGVRNSLRDEKAWHHPPA
jgi:hypothetical protein